MSDRLFYRLLDVWFTRCSIFRDEHQNFTWLGLEQYNKKEQLCNLFTDYLMCGLHVAYSVSFRL